MRALHTAFFLPNKAAWRQAIRMTAAALLAYTATGIVGLQHGYWAVITCLVIVQGSLGATISAGLTRVAGTAAGAAIGGIGALALRLYGGVPEWLILLLVIVPLALLAASRAIFRLGPLTGALVLLLAGSSNLGFAFSRVAEIALGTLIGVLVSIFVLPERATATLIAHAAALLEQLGAFAVLLLQDSGSPAHERATVQLRSGFAQMHGDMKEVENERNVRVLRSDPFAEHLSRHLQRLRTDVNMLGRAAASDAGKGAHAELAERIQAIFRDYAAALRRQAALPELRQLNELTLGDAPETPLGFAVLTLQAELTALHDLVRQRALAAPATPGGP